MLIEPTQYQPRQAQPIADEKRVGTWKQTKYSGAVKRDRKAQLTERCTMLLGAVRQARERANRAHADQVSVGVPAFAFLLGWADRGRAPRRLRHPESHRR